MTGLTAEATSLRGAALRAVVLLQACGAKRRAQGGVVSYGGLDAGGQISDSDPLEVPDVITLRGNPDRTDA